MLKTEFDNLKNGQLVVSPTDIGVMWIIIKAPNHWQSLDGFNYRDVRFSEEFASYRILDDKAAKLLYV